MCPKQQNKSLAQVGATRSNVANSSVNIFFHAIRIYDFKGIETHDLEHRASFSYYQTS